MTRRLTTAIGALLLLGTALVGLPAFLITVHQQLGDLLPSVADLPDALLAPGDGGLFLLTLIGIGWACWVVFTLAFAVEVAARARGIRAPRLGPFVPQRATAWAITAILLALTPTPAPSPTHATTQSTSASQASVPPAPSAASIAGAQTRETAAVASQTVAIERDADGVRWRDYRVKRGDTLWDVADRNLHDPTEWPDIAQVSRDITQPGGERLTDPDHIEPGWTLHIPTIAEAEPARTERSTPHADKAPSDKRKTDAPPEPPGTSEVPTPSTPLRPPQSDARSSALGQDGGGQHAPSKAMAGAARAREHPGGREVSTAPPRPVLPATPLRPPAGSDLSDGLVAEPELGLPGWVADPAKPAALHDSPETRSLVLRTLAAHRGLG